LDPQKSTNLAADLGNLGIFPWFPNLQPKKKSAEPNNQINQLGIQMARAKSPTISSVAVPLRRIAVFFRSGGHCGSYVAVAPKDCG
jgi:hypothetical protein